jgi:hypothetical protein
VYERINVLEGLRWFRNSLWFQLKRIYRDLVLLLGITSGDNSINQTLENRGLPK